jgi:hypothetical protein
MVDRIAAHIPKLTSSDAALVGGIHAYGIYKAVISTHATGPAAIFALALRRTLPTGVGRSLLDGQWRVALTQFLPGLRRWWSLEENRVGLDVFLRWSLAANWLWQRMSPSNTVTEAQLRDRIQFIISGRDAAQRGEAWASARRVELQHTLEAASGTPTLAETDTDMLQREVDALLPTISGNARAAARLAGTRAAYREAMRQAPPAGGAAGPPPA